MRKKTVTELLSEFKKEHPLYDELKFEGQGGIPEACSDGLHGSNGRRRSLYRKCIR